MYLWNESMLHNALIQFNVLDYYMSQDHQYVQEKYLKYPKGGIC